MQSYSIRDPSEFTRLVHSLRHLPFLELASHKSHFVSDVDLAEIKPSGANWRRPEFGEEPIPALLNWLLRKGTAWRAFLLSDSREAQLARGLLHLADYHLGTFSYEPEEKSALTLVVRRLIWFTASGINIFSRQAMLSILSAYGSSHLPKSDVSRPLPMGVSKRKSTVYFENCASSTVNAFLNKACLFLQGLPINGNARDEEVSELAADRGLEFYLNDQGELMHFRVEPVTSEASPLASLHEAHAAATSLLAPDPRGLIALSELLREPHFDPKHYAKMSKRMRHRQVRVLAGLLSALTGTSLNEVLYISLFPPRSREIEKEHFQNSGVPGHQKVLGYVCEYHEWEVCRPNEKNASEPRDFWLVSMIGPSRHRGLESRIQNQPIFLPLPRELSRLIMACRELANFEDNPVPTIGVLLGKNALELIRSGLKRTFPGGDGYYPWRDKAYATFIRRPDRAFRYVALVECPIPPPVLSLILGRPVGVWRASLNYTCVSREQVAEATRQVQKRLLAAAGFDNPTYGRHLRPGSIGAGLLVDGKIGPPGIPSPETLIPGSTPPAYLSAAWARLDYLKRLWGERFSHDLPNPQLNFRDHIGCLAIADKNLGGRIYPRIIPVVDTLAAQLADPLWRKLPDFCRPSPKRLDLVQSLRRPQTDPNAGRKSLYSELIARKVGDEALSAIFGHGLCLTKVFGPISPIPLIWFLGQTKLVLEEVVPDTANASPLVHVTARQVRRFSETRPTPVLPDFPTLESPTVDVDVQHLPIPDEETFAFLRLLWAAIRDRWRTFKNRPIELRRCLFLALSLHAMPMRRLWLLRYYVVGNSLVRLPEENNATFLIAPMPQKDLGMGLVPLRFTEEAALVIWPMVETLRDIAVQKRSASTPLDFDSTLLFPEFSEDELKESVRLAMRFTSVNRRKVPFGIARAHLEGGCKFLCRSRFGAQIFNVLNGRAVVPPNYFALEDVFFQAFKKPVSPISVTGSPWRNVFVPSQRLLQRELARRDGTAQLPKPSLKELSLFCRRHFSFATARTIESWLENPGFTLPAYPYTKKTVSSEKNRQLWARRIARDIMRSGGLHVGSPEHLLFPQHTARFFEIFDNLARLASHIHLPKLALQWWPTLVLLLGCRSNEASLIEPQHVDDHHRPRIIRIEGTKTECARRTVDLLLLSSDAVGAWLFQRFMALNGGHWMFSSHSVFKNLNRTSLQEEINRLLAHSYDELRAELGLPSSSGTFSLKGLRHACAFRLCQHAVQNSLWGGNLWTQLASISTALGHQSMLTTWSSYVGTCSLALNWPDHQTSAPYNPLGEPTQDILFKTSCPDVET